MLTDIPAPTIAKVIRHSVVRHSRHLQRGEHVRRGSIAPLHGEILGEGSVGHSMLPSDGVGGGVDEVWDAVVVLERGGGVRGRECEREGV
jgi:hypothetical protein